MRILLASRTREEEDDESSYYVASSSRRRCRYYCCCWSRAVVVVAAAAIVSPGSALGQQQRDPASSSTAFSSHSSSREMIDNDVGEESNNRRDDWYSRYPAYPPYCSIPSQMERRTVPPLSNDDTGTGETRLVHVTAVIRHGARTPWSGNIRCWGGWEDNPETGVWNCNLTTVIAPPSPGEIKREEGPSSASAAGGTTDDDKAMFLFEKKYDALLDPADGLSNVLRGTCQQGQLLLRGYEQELSNGRHLRDAYVYDGTQYSNDHDVRMRLLDVSKTHDETAEPWKESNLYYRVDDDQRTLMSGQVILRGLLGQEIQQYYEANGRYPVVPLHTADRDRDVLDPNEDICPRLEEIRERYQHSAEYTAFNQSTEATLLRRFQRDVLNVPVGEDMHSIDCLMTTICTDRPLPDAINDYTGEPVNDPWSAGDGNRRLDGHGVGDDEDDDNNNEGTPDYGKDLFQRLYDFDVMKRVLLFRENGAEYSKLAMGPLWAELNANLRAWTRVGEEEICCPIRPRSKMALFSGHDTTLMPLLSSLGPNVWDGAFPPYASMMIIELHAVNVDGQTNKDIYKSDYAFRLVYNGQVLTDKMEGCPAGADLCDANVLLDVMEPFARRDRDCQRQHAPPVEYEDTVSRAQEVLSTWGGVLALCVVIAVSALLGGMITFFSLTGLPVRRRKRHVVVSHYEEGDLEDDSDRGISMRAMNGSKTDDGAARGGGGRSPNSRYSDDDDNDNRDGDVALSNTGITTTSTENGDEAVVALNATMA